MRSGLVKEDAVAYGEVREHKSGGRAFILVLAAGVFLSLAVPWVSGQTAAKVKVKVQTANIRAEASMTATAVSVVRLGTVLEVVQRTGDWFKIKIPGGTATGYIHNSVVEEVKTETAPSAAPPPAARVEPPKSQTETPTPRSTAPPPVQSAAGPAADKEQAQMSGLEAKIKTGSRALLTLVQAMKPKVSEGQGTRQVKTAKIITARCQVLETNLQGARVIHSPLIGEEFAVLSQSDSFTKVRLRDGREGWITESCLQIFSKTETVKKVVYTGITGADQGNFLKVAEGFFSKLVQQKLFADEIAASYAKRVDISQPEKSRMAAMAERIRSYFEPAANFYNQYIAGQNAKVKEGRFLAEALSGWANLLLGTANYGSQLLSGASSKENGMTIDLDAGGSLALNESSKVDLSLSQVSDVIGTPYSSTTVAAGYAFRGGDSLNGRAAASYNAFSDPGRTENSFGRFSLGGGGDYRLSEKTNLNLDYAFTNQAYSEVSNEGYSSHQVRFGGLVKQSASSRIAFQLRANMESSKSEFHNFLNLEPAVTYEKTGDNSRFGLNGRMELYAFGEAKENNYTRTQIALTSERSQKDSITSLDGGLALKSFANSAPSSYLQIRLKYSRSRSANGDRNFTATATTDLYTNEPANSLTDIRLDYGANSAALFYNVGLYSRIWHKPAWGTFSSRPFVFDFLGRLGFNLKYLRIGPTLGIHALVSAEEGVKLIARKGNVFRLGAAADAEIPLPRGGRLNLSAWYEYGFTYENALYAYGGDLLQRHPTNLQLRGDFSLPVLADLEIVGQVDFYKIATGLDKTFDYNPVTSNTKLKLLVGIRYRYN
jgi:SH3-like domain-containing protein